MSMPSSRMSQPGDVLVLVSRQEASPALWGILPGSAWVVDATALAEASRAKPARTYYEGGLYGSMSWAAKLRTAAGRLQARAPTIATTCLQSGEHVVVAGRYNPELRLLSLADEGREALERWGVAPQEIEASTAGGLRDAAIRDGSVVHGVPFRYLGAGTYLVFEPAPDADRAAAEQTLRQTRRRLRLDTDPELYWVQ